MSEIFQTFSQADEEGVFVVLPDDCGFEAGQRVEIERVGDAWIVRPIKDEAITPAPNP